MHRSFVGPDWVKKWQENNNLSLPKEAQMRFSKVLRVKTSEKIAVFDGQGQQVEGYLNSLDGNLLQSYLVKKEPLKPAICLLQSALEETKIKECIKRATEFGVDKIIIFEAQRSEAFVFNKLLKKQEKLIEIIIDASRQSGRFFVPKLVFEAKLNFALKDVAENFCGFFGDLASGAKLSENIQQEKLKNEIWLAVGPEGGLSDEEKNELRQKGFGGVLWSSFTLRSELAHLAPVSMFNGALGRA